MRIKKKRYFIKILILKKKFSVFYDDKLFFYYFIHCIITLHSASCVIVYQEKLTSKTQRGNARAEL